MKSNLTAVIVLLAGAGVVTPATIVTPANAGSLCPQLVRQYKAGTLKPFLIAPMRRDCNMDGSLKKSSVKAKDKKPLLVKAKAKTKKR